MPTTNNDLPSSPAARAFFAALDGSSSAASSSAVNTSSTFIQKRIQTLGWRNRYSQTERYPVQIGNDSTTKQEFTVLQVQRGELDGTYGTGATVWPASMVLIKYLERHASALVQNKRVVDLGAGTGVTSIAAALLGAAVVVCTDGEPAVVQLARDNIQDCAVSLDDLSKKDDDSAADGDCRNERLANTELSTTGASTTLATTHNIRKCPIIVQDYWWGTGTIPSMQDAPCDVILVSDCVLPKLYPIAPLVDALDELLVKRDDGNDAVAILSYEHRYFADYHPKEKFVELCDAKNLEVETVPIDQQDPVYSEDDIEVWMVSRSAAKL